MTGAGDGPDSAENREVSARVLGQGCLARCDARQGVVQTVQKTVKIPHAFLDMVHGAGSWTRLLTCPCWPRQGFVEVPQLQFIDWWWQLIMAMMS